MNGGTSLSHVSFIDNGELDQLCLPSKKGAQRLAGVDLNKVRCRHVLKSVLELSTKDGGFNSKDLADKAEIYLQKNSSVV